MTRRKRIVFAAISVLVAIAAPVGALLALDVYMHHRVERYAGVNVWGYRGLRVPRKARGEHRLVMIGGSTTFGYGVNWDESIADHLERRLRPLSKEGAPVRVVNLGFNTQGAYAFRFAEEDFLALDYDTAILYEGYNDLGDEPNQFVGRRDSPIFRLFGYYPILQMALKEKAMALRSGGDLNAAYGGKTVFRPNVVSRASASTLEAVEQISRSLDRQVGRFSKVPPVAQTYSQAHVDDLGCPSPWPFYCAAVRDGIRFALDHQKKVLVVTQPYLNDRHREQQAALRSMLAAHFGGNSRVGYTNAGDAIDLLHSRLAADTMHLTSDGNDFVAALLVPAVVALMPDVFSPPADTASRSAR